MLKVTKCKVEIFKEQYQNNYKIGNPTEFIILIRETVPKIWEMIRPELKKQWFFNPFYFTGLLLYPQKTPENQSFSDVFKGYRKRPMAQKALKTEKKH